MTFNSLYLAPVAKEYCSQNLDSQMVKELILNNLDATCVAIHKKFIKTNPLELVLEIILENLPTENLEKIGETLKSEYIIHEFRGIYFLD